MSTELDLSFLVEAFDAPADPDALAGVLFAEDFDLPTPPPQPPPAAPAPEPPPAPPPAVDDDAQLRQARLLGYEDGRQAGLDETAARAKLAEEAAMLALVRSLTDARAAAQATAQAAASSTAQSMLDLLAVALPQFCARHGAAEARALAETLLPMLAHQPRITLRANPHTLPALQHAAAAHQQEQPGRIMLVPTDAMQEGDVAIEWQDGRAARDTTSLRRQLACMLAPLGLDMAGQATPHAARKELEDV